MRAVAMMRQAIKDSNLNGLKWTADKEGLHWEYLDITFALKVETEESGYTCAKFTDGIEKSTVFVLKPDEPDFLVDSYHDFVRTVDQAIYWAARHMISKANYLY